MLCLPHFSRLTEVAGLKMSKKYAPDFAKAAAALCRNYLTELRGDVSHFCKNVRTTATPGRTPTGAIRRIPSSGPSGG